jgi:hypothetical protein
MAEHYIVTGTLSDQKTVILDEPISLPTGRVRITVERLSDHSFWTGLSVAELAKAQGVQPIQTLDQLWGDFWPEDESIDEFIDAIYQWRHTVHLLLIMPRIMSIFMI